MTSYLLTDLGTFNDTDINASGQAVGYSWNSTGAQRAMLWTDAALIDLGTLGGGSSAAAAINDLGQVVGTAYTADHVHHAFLLTPEDTDADGCPDRWFRDLDGDGANDLMVNLGLPSGATTSFAAGVNNAGQVVGKAGFGENHSEAFLWDGGAFTVLGTLGGANSSAHDINDASQVVGSAQDAVGRSRAFLWDSSHGMSDLGTLTGYTDAVAYSISTFGSVVGEQYNLSTGSSHAFAWTPSGTTGTMTSLATSDASSAEDINDAGVVVVGHSTYVVQEECTPDHPYYPNCGGSTYYFTSAMLWENGVASDLNNLLPDNQGFILHAASAINTAGQILAAASDSAGNPRAVLLTPFDAPRIAVSDVNVVEGNSGTVSAVFIVSLSAAYDQIVTVTYATASGNALGGSDYVATSGTLIFAPGETSKMFTVPVKGDRIGEPNETFFVNMSNPTNATISDGQGQGTIVDNEPRITISDLTKAEGKKNQTTLFTFTVSLSAAYDQPVTMSYRTVNGTATIGNDDYVARTGTLIFAPGETTKTITIEVKGDTKKETDETFYLDLFGNSSNSLITKSRGIGTILNDD